MTQLPLTQPRVPTAALRAVALGVMAVGLEWARALVTRQPEQALPALLMGGVALCLLGVGFKPAELGLSGSHLGSKLLAGVALGAVLLLPAIARRSWVPVLPLPFALAAITISVGEEVAFRGALFAALNRWLGPVPAILGSTLAFGAGHVLSHPPEFLLAVAAAGLLLAIWRWAFDDLVAPIVAHTIADLLL